MDKNIFILVAVVLFLALSEGANEEPMCSQSLQLANINVQIVGGIEIDVENAPWQASITNTYGQHICGGAVVSELFIVTAAQCFGYAFKPKYVRTGSSKTNRGGIKSVVNRVLAHELYDDYSYDYDIGIIELKKPLKFSDTTSAIPLVEQGVDLHVGQFVQVTGWGPKNLKPNELQEVHIPISDYDECRQKYYAHDISITGNMHCADGFGEDGEPVCGGDIGAPVALDGMLLGVVSRVVSCCRPEIPMVYANIAALRNWVNDKAGLNETIRTKPSTTPSTIPSTTPSTTRSTTSLTTPFTIPPNPSDNILCTTLITVIKRIVDDIKGVYDIFIIIKATVDM